ncbi:MAG: hypothetical protein ACLFS1_05230 [Opitutales bacterium]
MALLKTALFFCIALVLAVSGLLVPAHLRSLDPAALEAAAESASSNAAQLKASLNAAHIGPAGWIAEATGARPEQDQSIRAPLENRPAAALIGGPDPGFQAFIERLPDNRYAAAEPTPVIPLLLPRRDRSLLADTLESSTRAHVTALLKIRELPGMRRLHPASHPAGAPFDAGLLTLAQLIESGHIDPTRAEQLGDLANQAAGGNTRAIAAVEELVTAILSLGRQLDFRSLANLANFESSISNWADMGTLFRTRPKQTARLFTALHYEKDSQGLFQYLTAHPETGDRDLQQALLLGPGAVHHLLEAGLPIRQPTQLAERILGPFAAERPARLAEFAASEREAALLLKLALLLLAGLALSLALGAAWRGSSHTANRVGRLSPAVLARNLCLSIAFTLTLWFVFEPEVLQSSDTEINAAPRLEFAVASAVDTIQSPVKTMQELNQVTLFVLALFFVLQLLVYCFCLIKLKEIARQNLDPATKLRLLDNEENLFDFGLYLGLGGTVLALILVAVGIVEASLMAAYASTLFGILFVALLKVLHLRPYRRSLILETEK